MLVNIPLIAPCAADAGGPLDANLPKRDCNLEQTNTFEHTAQAKERKIEGGNFLESMTTLSIIGDAFALHVGKW